MNMQLTYVMCPGLTDSELHEDEYINFTQKAIS